MQQRVSGHYERNAVNKGRKRRYRPKREEERKELLIYAPRSNLLLSQSSYVSVLLPVYLHRPPRATATLLRNIRAFDNSIPCASKLKKLRLSAHVHFYWFVMKQITHAIIKKAEGLMYEVH
jgi:hypothetical protein